MPQTHRPKQAHKKRKTLLKILQVNVGRGGVANDLALQYAFVKECDLVLIQEPWIGKDLDRRISKKHIGFQAYAPEDQWSDRPRVLTYVKRNLQGIQIEKRQDLLMCSPDSLVMELKSPKVSPFYVVNLYNGPRGCLREGEVSRFHG